MIYKKSLLALVVSSILIPSLSHAEPQWVEDNTENAEGIATTNPQEASLPSVTLSKVIVSGVLKEDLEIAESAASIAHFNAKEVERLNATSLGNLLTYEPGVNADESTTGGLSNIRIRGVGDTKVMMMVDGVPIPAAFKFGEYLATSGSYFDIDAMKSIDIIKGPMSTLYGGSALAGGVFMQTKDPSDFITEGQRVGGEIKIGHRTASRETLYSGTIAGKFTDKLSAFTRLTYTDGHERRNAYGRSSSSMTGDARKKPNPADSNNHNSLTKIVFDANEDHRFSLSYEDFKETAKLNPLSTLTATKISSYKKTTNKRQQVNLRHDFNVDHLLFDRGFWNLYYQKNSAKQWSDELRTTSLPSKISVRDRFSTYKNKSFGLAVEFNKEWAQNDAVFHNFSYGLNYREQKVSTMRYGDDTNAPPFPPKEKFPHQSFPDSKIRETGIFLQDRITLFDGQYEIIAGIRYDHYKLSPKMGTLYEEANPTIDAPVGMSKSRFSKRLAFLWHPNEENTFFVNYSEGFKAPSFSALNLGYGSDLYGYISRSNPNLKPESSKAFELGWNYIDDTKSFSVTGFYTKYNNFIEEQQCVANCDIFQINNPNHDEFQIFEAINLNKSYIYGIEAKASMDLFTIQNGSGVIGFSSSLSYAKGREKGTKRPINSVEPLTAVLGLEYSYLDQLYLSARIKGVAAKNRNDIYNSEADTKERNEIGRTAGYATVDLIAEYKPTRNITINGGLYNIFDKKYITWGNRMLSTSKGDINRLTNPGFNAALSIKYEF